MRMTFWVLVMAIIFHLNGGLGTEIGLEFGFSLVGAGVLALYQDIKSVFKK